MRLGDGIEDGLGDILAFKLLHVAEPHNCIGYRLVSSDAIYKWDLKDRGEDISVAVKGSVRVTDSLYARDLALEGLGIAYLLEPLVREHLKAGRLREVLPAASMDEPGLFIYSALCRPRCRSSGRSSTRRARSCSKSGEISRSPTLANHDSACGNLLSIILAALEGTTVHQSAFGNRPAAI